MRLSVLEKASQIHAQLLSINYNPRMNTKFDGIKLGEKNSSNMRNQHPKFNYFHLIYSKRLKSSLNVIMLIPMNKKLKRGVY